MIMDKLSECVACCLYDICSTLPFIRNTARLFSLTAIEYVQYWIKAVFKVGSVRGACLLFGKRVNYFIIIMQWSMKPHD